MVKKHSFYDKPLSMISLSLDYVNQCWFDLQEGTVHFLWTESFPLNSQSLFFIVCDEFFSCFILVLIWILFIKPLKGSMVFQK